MKDPSLRACSLEARGLWIDIICLMFESPIRGELRHANGNPITETQLGRICGADALLIQKITTELSDAGVYSKSDDGALVCRRMVRDEEIRKIRAEAGKSGGNPALLKQKASKTEAKGEQTTKQNTTPSSSSSSSELKEKESPIGDRQPSADTCPHSEILDLYAKVLPQLTQPLRSRWPSSAGASSLRVRWREDKRHQDLKFWEWFFGVVASSPFHLGQNDRGWKADLPWLLERRNFDKMLEKGVSNGR